MLKVSPSKHFNKFIWPIAGTVLGGVLTPLILSSLQNHSPEIVVRQYFSTVESHKAVPKQIGGLSLDYQPEAATLRSLYLIEISNEGKGPEEALRVQVGFPKNMKVSYSDFEEPDFRVYRPEEVSLNQNKFFISLNQFPSRAHAPVSFDVGEDAKLLCQTAVKVAGKEKEGRVEKIRGVSCD